MTIERSPGLARVLDAAMQYALSNIFVSCPAQVVSYDATKQTIDAQPCIGRTIIEEDRSLDETLPIVPHVPLIFPGSGPYRLTFPVAVGDYVLLVFADRSIDEFVAKGGNVVPAALHNHEMIDAFAIAGVTPLPNALSSVATNVMVLGKNGNPHQPAARKGDGVGSGTIAVSATAGAAGAPSLTAVTITYTPGDGSLPQTTVASVASPAGTGTLTVKEKIVAGSADVEIT